MRYKIEFKYRYLRRLCFIVMSIDKMTGLCSLLRKTVNLYVLLQKTNIIRIKELSLQYSYYCRTIMGMP